VLTTSDRQELPLDSSPSTVLPDNRFSASRKKDGRLLAVLVALGAGF
jgi:hypothetical protein